MAERLSVTVIPDGPLKISNASRVRFCGDVTQVEGDLYLCRCGDSANAPYCDGTHSKKGFKGSSKKKKAKGLKVWEGSTLRTVFNPNTCMHVLYCKPLDALREAELAGDEEAAMEIMRVVGSCPSGALRYELKEDIDEATAPGGVPIDIIEGGEVRLQTRFDLNASLNEGQPDDRATLCRCGLSKSKPFCDGRHKGKKDFR